MSGIIISSQKNDQKKIKEKPKYIENFFSKEIENLWSGVYELFFEGTAGKGQTNDKEKNIQNHL